MFATAVKLALAAAVLVLLAPSADAQRSYRICEKSKDKVKCNCIFQSGGRFYHRPGGRPGLAMDSMANVDRYIACMRRNGRPGG